MRHSLIAVTVVGLLLVEATAWGQFNRNSSKLGSSSMKSNSSSNSMFGNLFSSSGSGGARSSSSSTGTRSLQNPLSGTTNDNMLRSSRGAANFVGADASDNRNFLGYANTSSRGAQQNSLRRTNASTSNVNRVQRSGYSTGSGSRTTTIRPTLDVGFDYTGPAPESLVPKLTTRLTKVPTLRFVQPVEVVIEKGVVVLKGTVRTEHDRALAEQLILQEPGVRQVENRLAVAP
jgi:hypothetical protein